MRITGIKKAVGEYQRLNAGGQYSPQYAVLMLDRSTGEVWTDEFYSLGHNSWKEYHDDAIINLGYQMGADNIPVNMANVKAAAEAICDQYNDERN